MTGRPLNSNCAGLTVVSVHFDHEKQPHALVVAYNPDAVTSETVLAEIRKHDSKAVMAGF